MNKHDKDQHTSIIEIIKPAITEEMEQAAPPLVSIHIPVHHNERTHRQSRWDSSQLTECLQQAKWEVERRWNLVDKPAADAVKYNLKLLEQYVDELDVMDTDDGCIPFEYAGTMSFFVDRDKIYATKLTPEVPEAIVQVSDTWFVKPLIRNMADMRQFYVLSVGTDRCVLSQGDEHRLFDPLRPFGAPENYAEDRAAEFDGDKSSLDYYSLDGHYSPYEGHKSRNDVKEEIFAKFSNVLAKQLDAYLAEDTDKIPVVVCCAKEHMDVLCNELSKMARKEMIAGFIEKDPSGLTSGELHDCAADIIDEIEHAKVDGLLSDFYDMKAKGMASIDIGEIASALAEGRVGTLVVAYGRGIPGKIVFPEGSVEVDMDGSVRDDRNIDEAGPDLSNTFVLAALASGTDIALRPTEDLPDHAESVAFMRWASRDPQ